MSGNADTQQILDAFAALTDDELAALRKTASCYIGGTRFSEPLDLIHEVMHRLLTGARHWPDGVEFGMCVAMVCQSVANGERQRRENQPGARMALDDALALNPRALGCAGSPEDALIAREEAGEAFDAAASIRSALAGDSMGQRVLAGMLSGTPPREMRERLGMTPKEFDAARHRVMRRVAPSGSAPSVRH